MKKILSFIAGGVLLSTAVNAQIVPQGVTVYSQLPAQRAPKDTTFFVRFETGKFNLDSADLVTLDSIYKNVLLNEPTRYYSLSLIGHADSIGRDSFNLALSQKRAETVTKYFNSKDSVNGIRKTAWIEFNLPCVGKQYYPRQYAVKVTTDWKGEKEPIADNGTDSGRALNRRTAIRLFEEGQMDIARYSCQVPDRDMNFDGAKNTHVYVPAGSIMKIDSLPFQCNAKANVDISETYGMEDVVKSAPLIDAKGKTVLYLGKVDLATTPAQNLRDCKVNRPNSTTTFNVEVPVSQAMLDKDVKVYYFEYDTTGNKTLKRAQAQKSSKTNGELALEFSINPYNTGTIFLGKELDPKKVKKYTYRVKKDNGQPTSMANNKKYSFAKVKGSKMKYKKRLKKLFGTK